MKVLMLGWELPPHNSGGLGVACYQLCKALASKGADIEFILPFFQGEPTPFMKITSIFTRDQAKRFYLGSVYDHSWLEHGASHSAVGRDLITQQVMFENGVYEYIKSESYDVIHAHDWLTFRAALKAKQHKNIPLIAHIHSVESDRSAGLGGNPFVQEIEALGLMMADHIIAVSELTKRSIIHDYNIPADKIEVIHNSLDHDEMMPLDSTNAYHYLLNLKALGYQIVTNVGRLTMQKGLPFMLQAAKSVVERLPKTIFLIVGSGDQYHELIELAASLGISQNVIFVGFQRGKSWRDAFAIADLFLMPSVSEPFGLTPLEAAFYGTPSLISRQSGVSELLYNCLKVDYWDTNEMANKIVAVLSSHSLRKELERNVQHEIRHLTWHASAERVNQLYERNREMVPA